MARPTLFTIQIQNAVCKAILGGDSQRGAAKQAGIGLIAWMLEKRYPDEFGKAEKNDAPSESTQDAQSDKPDYTSLMDVIRQFEENNGNAVENRKL